MWQLCLHPVGTFYECTNICASLKIDPPVYMRYEMTLVAQKPELNVGLFFFYFLFFRRF